MAGYLTKSAWEGAPQKRKPRELPQRAQRCPSKRRNRAPTRPKRPKVTPPVPPVHQPQRPLILDQQRGTRVNAAPKAVGRSTPEVGRLAKRAQRARSPIPGWTGRQPWELQGSYADCRALHSQRPTGSLSIMTLVPSTSVRQKSLNTWIHTPWLKVFLGEPSASRYTPVRSSTWSK